MSLMREQRPESGEWDFGLVVQPPLVVRMDAPSGLRPTGGEQRIVKDTQIYAEGSPSEQWFQVKFGTVRLLTTQLVPGRRCVGGFCL
jgi:hypothetical protein